MKMEKEGGRVKGWTVKREGRVGERTMAVYILRCMLRDELDHRSRRKQQDMKMMMTMMKMKMPSD